MTFTPWKQRRFVVSWPAAACLKLLCPQLKQFDSTRVLTCLRAGSNFFRMTIYAKHVCTYCYRWLSFIPRKRRRSMVSWPAAACLKSYTFPQLRQLTTLRSRSLPGGPLAEAALPLPLRAAVCLMVKAPPCRCPSFNPFFACGTCTSWVLFPAEVWDKPALACQHAACCMLASKFHEHMGSSATAQFTHTTEACEPLWLRLNLPCACRNSCTSCFG